MAAIIPFGYKADEAKELQQKEVKLEDRIHLDQW